MLKYLLSIYLLSVYTTALQSKCSISSQLKPYQNEKFQFAYQWQYINFTWPSNEKYQEAISSVTYIPGNNVILGVKYYKGKLYLALPKIKPGSPVTVAYISEDVNSNNPLLTPFPDWKTNLNNNCDDNLFDLQSFEIDNDGIMWAIDGRRVDKTKTKCPPKIVLLDLNEKGRRIQSYVTSNEVCSHENCFMNDLVLDDVDEGFAYITDSSFTDPGLIIYSRKENRAWKMRSPTMVAELDAINFTTHGISQTNRNNVNGIALSHKNEPNDKERILYYTALSAFTMYSINTQYLRNKTLATSPDIEKFIVKVGNKTAQSSGMIVDTSGQLYYGLVAKDTVLKWDTEKPISTAAIIETNPELMPWPDSYTFDNKGYLYLIASNVDRFGAGLLSLDNYNFKISKLYTGTCSYQFI